MATLVISLFDWNSLNPDKRAFNGLDNYASVFTDAALRESVLTTILLTAGVVIATVVLGLALALLLDRAFFGRGLVRTLLITPFLIVPVSAALLWKHALYNPEYGLLNGALSWVGELFGDTTPSQPDWIAEMPLLAVIAALVWQWTPFMMLILLAGLQSRPAEVVEAARLDGASAWQTFRYLTLPTCAGTSNSASCSAPSTSCRTSTRCSRSPPADSARPTSRTRSTRPSTRPTNTDWRPPRESSW